MNDQQETSTRQQRLNEVIAEYFAAAEAGGSPDREAFVEQHAPFATELREFFSDGQLFEHMAQTLSIAPKAAAAAASALNAGEHVKYFGDYELAGELARGGMGVVYKARQISLNRFVALKMILSGQFASTSELIRFRTEAESAAALDHPNIVPIHEVGEHHGQNYFTMKLIDGGNIEQWSSTHMPSQRQIAALIATVARAVHFGHQRGILHRDLKPGNVLVDSAGVPYVVDFGIAKRLAGDSGLTLTADVLGSPAYMAPEQAAGRARDVSVATDVYGLGAILYRLLAGRPPFAAASAAETLRMVLDSEPQRPRAAQPGINADLQTICLKCLDKGPARRYPTAQSLADDLERWLKGEPISARPISRAKRVAKWARRRPSLAALIGVTLVLLAVLAWAFPVSYVRVRRALAGETAALQENRDRLVQTSITRGIEASSAEDDGAALLLFAAALRDETNPQRQRVLRTRIALGLRQLPRIRLLLTGDTPLCFSADGKTLFALDGINESTWSGAYREFQASRLVSHDLSPAAKATAASVGHATVFTDVTTPVTRFVQTADVPGGVQLTFWDPARLKALGRTGILPGKPRYVAYSADSSHAAVLYNIHWNGPDQPAADVIESFDVGTGSELGPRITIPRIQDNPLECLQMNAAGTQIATVSGGENAPGGFGSDLFAKVWDIATGAPRFTAPVGHHSNIDTTSNGQAIFSPDATRLLTLWGGPGCGVMRTWDLGSGKPLGDEQFLSSLAVSGGNWFIAPEGGFEGNDMIWINLGDSVSFRFAQSGQPRTEMSPGGSVNEIGYSPDRRTIVSASSLDAGHAVRFWAAGDHHPLTPRMIFGDNLQRVLFSPDAGSVAIASQQSSQPVVTEVRDTVAPSEQSAYFQPPEIQRILALSPNGHRELAYVKPPAAKKGDLEIVDLQTGGSIHVSSPVGRVQHAQFSPDGSRIALVTQGKAFLAAVLNSTDGKPILAPFRPVPQDPGSECYDVRFSPDGAWIVMEYDQEGQVGPALNRRQAWNAANGVKLEFPGAEKLNIVCFSDDARMVLLAERPRWNAYSSQGIRVWDVAACKQASPVLPRGVDCACFSPDGGRLLLCGTTPNGQTSLTFYDVATGREVWSVATSLRYVQAAFSPDGSRIAAWSGKTIDVRSATDGSAFPLPIDCFDPYTTQGGMRFSSDGLLLIVWSTSDIASEVRIYDARTSEPLAAFAMPSPFQSMAPPVFPSVDRMLMVHSLKPIDVNFAPDARDPNTLDKVIQLLSGRKLQSNGLIEPLSTDEMLSAWKAVKPIGTPEVGAPADFGR
jgi:WD40 repeat protein